MGSAIHDSQQPADYSNVVQRPTRAVQHTTLHVKIEKLSYEMGKEPLISRLFHKLGISEKARTLENMKEALKQSSPLPDIRAALTDSKNALENIQKELRQLDKTYLESYTDEETKRVGDLGQQARVLEGNIAELEKVVARAKEGPDLELVERLTEKRHDIKQMKAQASSTPIGRIMLALGIGKDAQKIQEERMLKQQLYSQAIEQTGSRAAAKAATASTFELPEGCKVIRNASGAIFVAENKDGKWIDKYREVEIPGDVEVLEKYDINDLPEHLKKLGGMDQTLQKKFEEVEQVAFVVKGGKSSEVAPDMRAAFVTDKSTVFSREVESNGLYAKMELQAKGYLPEGEYAADWATIDTIGNMTLAIVADAAGNTQASHMQVMEDTARFKTALMRELNGKSPLTPAVIGNALGNAIRQTELERSGKKSTSMVATLILETENGKKYAVGAGIGDARAMLKRQDGSTKDLTPSDYKRSYSDADNAFGTNLLKKKDPAIIFERLEEGDTLLLGSDCFGDNMEAKTLGTTPREALKQLQEAKMIDESISADSLPDSWKHPGEPQELLQKIHTLYSEYMLRRLGPSEIHGHCTESTAVRAGLFLLDIEKEIDQTKDKGSVLGKHFDQMKEVAGKLGAELAFDTPDAVYKWLMSNVGKPDDYSLIALTVGGKPSEDYTI